jgi:GTP-binding protein hflX
MKDDKLIYTADIKEKVLLIAVASGDGGSTHSSLNELEELAETAGARVLGRVVQNRESLHPATYVGKGKLDEVRLAAYELGATGVVCDDELSPAQLRNLEDELEIKVMDRTMLILDIFAKRASTLEGKIQVELAQLKYSAARLAGLRASLSRLGGGIGTRGPGEKKISMDRRLIHSRIGQLKAQLEEVKKHREVNRKGRQEIFTAAIVGYTNAGKSTLLNVLSNSDVFVEDKLFATLDPSTRKMKLNSGQEILITDTVGFIRKLPHNLIEAFKSTFEEAIYADLIIHLVDASSPGADEQLLVVYEALKSFNISGKDIITVYNKMDIANRDLILPRDFHSDYKTEISAKTGYGIEGLKELIEKIIRSRRVYINRVFSYKEVKLINEIRSLGELEFEEYKEEGIYIGAWIGADIYSKIITKY